MEDDHAGEVRVTWPEFLGRLALVLIGFAIGLSWRFIRVETYYVVLPKPETEGFDWKKGVGVE